MQRLMDPMLQARVAFWLRPKAFSLRDVKLECKSNSIPVTGNKKVLALRLAFKNLPADVDASLEGGYTVTKSSPNKQGGKRVKMDISMGEENNKTASGAKRPSEDTSQAKKKKAAKKVTKTPEPVVAVVDEKCKTCGRGALLGARGCQIAIRLLYAVIAMTASTRRGCRFVVSVAGRIAIRAG